MQNPWLQILFIIDLSDLFFMLSHRSCLINSFVSVSKHKVEARVRADVNLGEVCFCYTFQGGIMLPEEMRLCETEITGSLFCDRT